MSLPPEKLQERYSAIERAYSERRWPEVESLSQGLLAELDPIKADPLRLRLVLLQGHTRLYGLTDPSGARQYYASVLQHCEEPTLRDIAQQGLAQCDREAEAQLPITQAAAPWLIDSAPSEAGAATNPAASDDASPWLSELAGAAGQESGQTAEEPESPSPAAAPAADLPAIAPQAVPAPEASTPEQEPGLAAEPEQIGEAIAERVSEPEAELVGEIVDEPEQIAVAQANPLLRQELVLEELTSPGEDNSSASDSPGEWTADQLDDLSRGLLRIRLP
ncbi:MAG: hypothetical protein ACKOCI_05245 [Cyanobium sp.]